MSTIRDLLKDRKYMTDLLNGPCQPRDEQQAFTLINSEWIDTTTSDTVTDAFHRLLPDGIPYITEILTERNPDTLYGGACVEEDAKRLRYIVATVIPDTEYPFDCSFPLIHEMWVASLNCWEIIRATLQACTREMAVRIVNKPVPPILNSARIQWISLYLGRKPYRGISLLSEQWANPDEFDGNEIDVHLLKVRELPSDPILQKLIDAYDADFPKPTQSVATDDTEV